MPAGSRTMRVIVAWRQHDYHERGRIDRARSDDQPVGASGARRRGRMNVLATAPIPSDASRSPYPLDPSRAARSRPAAGAARGRFRGRGRAWPGGASAEPLGRTGLAGPGVSARRNDRGLVPVARAGIGGNDDYQHRTGGGRYRERRRRLRRANEIRIRRLRGRLRGRGRCRRAE